MILEKYVHISPTAVRLGPVDTNDPRTGPASSRSVWKRTRSDVRSARNKRSSSKRCGTAAPAVATRAPPSRRPRRSRVRPGNAPTAARSATSRPTKSTYALIAPMENRNNNKMERRTKLLLGNAARVRSVLPSGSLGSAATEGPRLSRARATNPGTPAAGTRFTSARLWAELKTVLSGGQPRRIRSLGKRLRARTPRYW